MKTTVRKTWRELSEAAAREQDPEKLLELVEQLNKALEKQGHPVEGVARPIPSTRFRLDIAGASSGSLDRA